MATQEELDYSRLHVLGDKFKEFLNTLPDGTTENPDFALLMFAHDIKNKVSGTFTILDSRDERESLVQCIDNCITRAALKGKDKNPNEWELLNGLGEYMMRLCAMFPPLWENFQKGVEKYKAKEKETKVKEERNTDEE